MPPAAQASSGVASLVASIKQHKKFRQLASYSVQCLCKVITPPHVGWERNLKDAFDSGALEAITDVLQRHSGDEDVLTASTACLSSMATNPKYAAALVESGAIMGMLESVVKNPSQKDGVKETLKLLETVASNNPEALLAGGGADAATRLMIAAPTQGVIVSASVRTLEKLNKVPGGSAALIECDAVKTVIGVVERTKDGDVLEASFRLLERMARAPEHAEYIRTSCDGLRVLSNALETNSTESRVTKIGGRLLTKLASGSVSDLIGRMESTSVPAEKEFLACLLANLALEEENSEKIITGGGIPALLNVFNGGAKKTVEAASRALGRIASSDDAAEEVLRTGTVTVFVKTMDANRNDATMTSAITTAVSRLASSPERAQKIARAGGVEAVIRTLVAHPEFEAHSLDALNLIDNLATQDFEVSRLTELGAVPAIAAAMKAHTGNADIQVAGIRALIFFSYNEANVRAMITNGVLERTLSNLASEKKDTVVAAMYLATSLSLLPGTKDKLGSAGIDTLLGAISKYAKDEVVRETAEELLSAIVSEDEVAEAVADLGILLDEALESKKKDTSARLKNLATKVGAYAVTAEYAELMIRSDGISALVRALEEVSTTHGIPDQEGILQACSRALVAIAAAVDDNAELRQLLGRSGALKAAITSVKLHPKLVKHVTSAVSFLETAGQLQGLSEQIAEEGGVEACVSALRANSTNAEVVTSAVTTLLQIASTDKGAIAVAKHGGTRQVIAMVNANIGTPNFGEPMEKAVALLQRVSLTTEGAEVLVKQGGVDAVILATEKLERSGQGTTKGDSATAGAAASSRVLARLLTRDDVAATVEQLNELGGAAKRGRVPQLDAMKPVLAKVGHMATVGNFAEAIVKDGGAKSLSSIIAIVMSKADDNELKADVLPIAFKAIANISKTTKIDDSLGFAGHISAAIEGSFALTECLECIANIATSSETSAQQLCNDGRTLGMLVETLKSNIRNKDVAAACFRALAALASHASTAAIVANTPALRLVSDWVDDNIDDSSPEAVEAALAALAAMALSPSHAASMLEGGSVELVKTVLTKTCIEADEAAPGVLASAVSVLRRLGSTANAMSRISAAGALRRVVRAVSANPDYVKDEGAVSAVLDLMTQASAVGPVANELVQIGAQELIVAGMNANGTSEAVVKKGAAALQALGAGEEMGRVALEEVKTLSANLEKAAEITEDMVLALGEAVQRLGNFMVISGVVTPATAPAIMSTLSNAVALMAESELAPAPVLAAGVNSIGRLVELGGPAVEGSAKEAVEMVMDVLSMAQDSAPVRESTIHCLGQLAASPAGLSAITELGGIQVITDTAKSNPGDSKLQAIVTATMSRITGQTSKAAAKLVSTGNAGTATLVAVVQANAADTANLGNMLEQVLGVAGGDEAIYDVIAKPTTGQEVIVEALRVLRERSDLTPAKPIPGNSRRIAGLARALSSALALQATLTAASDQRTKLAALRMAENTLVLFSRVAFELSGATAFFVGGGIDNLMQLLGANIEDDETVTKITGILRSALTYANPQAASAMAVPANMGSIVGTLKLFLDTAPIVADCVEIMAYTARVGGQEGSGIDRDGMRAVSQASAQYPADPRIRAAVAVLQSVMASKFTEAEAAVKQMSSTLSSATQAIAAVGTVQELTAEDGRTYYYNSASGERTWEMPASYASFKSAMTSMQAVALTQAEDTVTHVDTATINTMVNALNTHVRNPAMAVSAATTLSALAMNDGNADAIAKSGGISTMIAAINANPQNVELLKSLLVLMERISRNDIYKEQIVSLGGAEVLINIAVGIHLGNEEITLKALSTLANLAFNSPPNIEALMQRNAVAAVQRVLQAYTKHPRVLENAMCALSNLMYGSDDNKLTIGQTCGDSVTNIIRDLPNDANLFKMALRALGNLSFCDANIRFIVEEHHATKAIVSGMRAHVKDEEAQQLAMEVLGNFASLEEEVETDAEGNVVNGKDSIPSIILREAGCSQIITNLRNAGHNSALIKAGFDALSNIANDVDVTETMAKKQNLVPVVIEVMQANDWDAEVITRAVGLLGVMTYSRECLTLIAQLDGIQALLSAMEQHGSSGDLLAAAQLALTNLAASEDARTAIRNMEGVATILGLFEQNITDRTYVTETMKTLTRLCADDRLSASIADRGMHILMAAVDRYNRDPDFLTVAFRLLGHLAFVESNLTIIVQHNGIHKVIGAITAHPDSKGLMVRSIQTLDNIAMANKENAAIVIDEGGKELIETIMETYAEDEEIQRYGKSALLSMSALENLSKSAEITAKAAKAGALGKKKVETGPVDPLAEYRHTLSAGKVMKVWTKGAPKAAHIVCSPDFRSIVWQEVGSQKKLGAMDLRTVVAVRAGTGDGHKKALLSTKTVDADLAFTVVGERASLDLEANNKKELGLWVEALSKLLTVFRTNPSAL